MQDIIIIQDISRGNRRKPRMFSKVIFSKKVDMYYKLIRLSY